MSDDTEDPREAVIERTIRAAHTCGWHRDDVSERPPVPLPSDALARIDAADPLRAMLPEVVKALEAARTEFFDVLASCDAERVHHDGDEFHERLGRIESALTRLRTLTPTEGDES